MRLQQLFTVDELKALTEKDLEIIKDAIRDEIASSTAIRDIVKKRAQQVYQQLRAGGSAQKY